MVLRVTAILLVNRQNKMVDAQIEQFENELRNDLEFQLMVHTPRRYWEELDALDNNTRENIVATLYDVFEPRIVKYQHTDVAPLMRQCRDFLGHIIWAAMNVPYPNNPDTHIDAVIDNSFGAYNYLYYARLRTEMIMVNHNTQVIQRTWRHVVSNPDYEVCRRRLQNEFKTLTDNNSM